MIVYVLLTANPVMSEYFLAGLNEGGASNAPSERNIISTAYK